MSYSNCYYHYTELVKKACLRQDVDLSEWEQLNRIETMRRLGGLYSRYKDKDISLSELDYDNLYNISYLLGDLNFEKCNVRGRVVFAKKFINDIKNNNKLMQSKLIDLLHN